MDQPTVTRHIPMRLGFKDGASLNVPSVEYFPRRQMVWIRGMELDASALKSVTIDQVDYDVVSVENQGSLCEVRLGSTI
jgi:hypothetical protein